MNWTGLAAQIWDASGGDEPQNDLEPIRAAVEQNRGPALDVGCGAGRIILRLLAAGLDVDGVDTSADMLALCRSKGEAQGLQPSLYQQAMQHLDLPRRYRTIFIPCGTFCLITDRSEARQALDRLHEHLQPGGELIFNLFWPFDDGGPLSDNPLGGDNEWRDLWSHELPDGRTVAQTLKRLSIDGVEQLLLAKRRYQLINDGVLVAEETFDSNERWYYNHEILLMLERAGFEDVRVGGNWTDEPFDESRHYSIVYRARRGRA